MNISSINKECIEKIVFLNISSLTGLEELILSKCVCSSLGILGSMGKGFSFRCNLLYREMAKCFPVFVHFWERKGFKLTVEAF